MEGGEQREILFFLRLGEENTCMPHTSYNTFLSLYIATIERRREEEVVEE